MENSNDAVILGIRDNNAKETGKPEPRANANSERGERLTEFVVLSFLSLVFSFVPICITGLVQKLEVGYFEFVFGSPEILFTVATLVISVFCEILYMDDRLGKLTRSILPFLFVLILWSSGTYTLMQLAESGTYGDVYRIPIILVTLVASLVLSGVAIVLANISNKKYNR